jgi:Fe-S oxidoreductase/FAD/FMN-containing dehydrogenase
MRQPDIDKDLRDLGIAFTTSGFERQFYTRELIALPRWVNLLFQTVPLAVTRPVSSAEVVSVLKYCFERDIPVVPRGAGTLGLFGTVPKKGGIVLDLTGFAKSVEVDQAHEVVHVDAGIVCWELDQRLRRRGLALKSYPSSALSATLGGWIMGSGLGIGSLMYGPVFDHIVSAEVVLADGTRRAVSAGEDLKWLWKSEGTLAVLTKVSLKVRKVPDRTSHHLVSFDDHARLFDFVRAIAVGCPLPYSVEILDSSYLSLLTRAGHDVTPFAGGAALVTYEGDRDTIEQARESLNRESLLFKGEKREGAETEWQNRFNMWRIKRALRTMLPIGVYVPLSRLGEFRKGAVKYRKRELALFGQVVSPAECLIMALVATDERHPLEHTLALHLPRRLFKLALSLGGRPGGGIGVLNAPYAKEVVEPGRIETFRRRKKEFDPKGILNPGMGKLVSPVLYHTGMWILSCIDKLFPSVRPEQEEQGLDRELEACVECGYCTHSCPTRGHWISSTPRGRILLMKEFSESPSSRLTPGEDRTKAIFSCTLCGRCAVDCCVGIDSPTLWVQSRNRLVQQGQELDSLKALSGVVTETGNIAGKPNAQRAQWAAKLPIYEEISRKRRAGAVYFVGCVTSFYPTVQDIGRSFARTLASAKIDFTVLGGEERCCGYPLISAGRLDQAVSQMRRNIETVKKIGADTLLVTCPGCHRMWKHEYERLTGERTGIDVFHSAEFLWQLIKTDKIRLGELGGLFTYHDPCDLGRVSGIYDAPRSIINSLKGIGYTELEDSRQFSACCGSGGDLLASHQELSLAIAQKRLDQVQQTGADTLVTACPSCIRGLIMAKMSAKRQLNILDITQFVWKALEKCDNKQTADKGV